MQKKTGKMLAVSLIFLTALSLTSTTSIIAMAQAEQPTYSIGNEWKYSIEFLSGTDVVMEGETTRKIIGEENVIVDSVEYECFVMEITSSWQPIPPDTIAWTESGTVYIQKSDLSMVRQDMEIKQMSGEEITYQQISNATYDPPYNQLDFPIDVAKIWWANTTRTQTIEIPPFPPSTGTTEISQNFTVVKTEQVTVPAGTFDTLVIKYATLDNINEEYYSSGANGVVKELVYDRNMNLMKRTELLESNRITPSGAIDTWLLLAVGIVAVVIVVVVIIFIRRRPAGIPKIKPSMLAIETHTSRKL